MSFEKKLTAIKNSSLWSAYGDALGFITELSNEQSLKYRTQVKKIIETVSWTRVIGGKFGVKVEFPAGAYSDDTQLRLATSRAIRGDGYFDVEAFAKIELPVWTSYALGAGLGSKVASNSLSKSTSNWFNNFFYTDSSIYIQGGGNGAAMRIQPHIWAAKDTNKILTYLPDVVKNSICTHGHPRGFAGAAFHAISLADTLTFERNLKTEDWLEIANRLPLIYKVITEDINLSSLWLPMWEELSKTSLLNSIEKVVSEIIDDIQTIEEIFSLDLNRQETYFKIVEAIHASNPEHRGSGVKTALLANVLAYLYHDQPPEDALILCVNLLTTDTDSIATMAGALLGATAQVEPKGQIQDKKYIESEAERLFAISRGIQVSSFNYPDLLHWQAPKNSLDAIGLNNEKIVMAGIGTGAFISEELYGKSSTDSIWQWMRLDIGQSVLCKRRKILKPMKKSNIPSNLPVESIRHSPEMRKPPISSNRIDLFTESPKEISSKAIPKNADASLDINYLTSIAIKSGFDPKLIGEHILRLVSENHLNGIELSVAYTAIIAKAITARAQSN